MRGHAVSARVARNHVVIDLVSEEDDRLYEDGLSARAKDQWLVRAVREPALALATELRQEFRRKVEAGAARGERRSARGRPLASS
jgi:hypothetical protein